MNDIPETARITNICENPGKIEPKHNEALRADKEPTLDLEIALREDHPDLKPLVEYLASRVWEAERRLVRLGQSMDRMRRKVGEVESQLAGLARQSSQHAESLRMMCTILKDLDDPYGFGTSLDERIACDRPDWITDEEG